MSTEKKKNTAVARNEAAKMLENILREGRNAPARNATSCPYYLLPSPCLVHLNKALDLAAGIVQEHKDKRRARDVNHRRVQEAHALTPFIATALCLSDARKPLLFAINTTPQGFVKLQLDEVEHAFEHSNYVPFLPVARAELPHQESLRWRAAAVLARALGDMDLASRRIVAQTLFPKSQAPPAKKRKAAAVEEKQAKRARVSDI
jgi:hypothetical protein